MMGFSRLVLGMVLVVGRSAGAQVGDGRLGSTCTADADCAAGLTCILPTATDFRSVSEPPERGGPAGGLCTVSCAEDPECWVHDETAICHPIDGFCREGCRTNEPLGDALTPEKCHGRSDMACAPIGCADSDCRTTVDFCSELCWVDEQCGIDLFCNLRTGLCQSSPAEGDPPGSACNFTAAENSCLGLCDLDPVELYGHQRLAGVCVEPCVIGAPMACGGPRGGGKGRACLRRLEAADKYGIGDLGACATLCNCTSDCADSEVCEPWGLGNRYDAAGVCARAARQPGAPDCLNPNSDAGASGCSQGEQRLCRIGACLGSTKCLPSGEYGDCECISSTDAGTADRDVQTAADAGPPGDSGANDASTEASPPRPGETSDSGCAGCSFPKKQTNAHVLTLLGLSISLAARRVTRSRKRVRSLDAGRHAMNEPRRRKR